MRSKNEPLVSDLSVSWLNPPTEAKGDILYEVIKGLPKHWDVFEIDLKEKDTYNIIKLKVRK